MQPLAETELRGRAGRLLWADLADQLFSMVLELCKFRFMRITVLQCHSPSVLPFEHVHRRYGASFMRYLAAGISNRRYLPPEYRRQSNAHPVATKAAPKIFALGVESAM